MCFKRSLKVLVLAALTSAIAAGTAFAGNLTVYSTSDVHGSLIGWNYFKAEKADVGLAKISTILNEARAHKGKDDAIMYVVLRLLAQNCVSIWNLPLNIIIMVQVITMICSRELIIRLI